MHTQDRQQAKELCTETSEQERCMTSVYFDTNCFFVDHEVMMCVFLHDTTDDTAAGQGYEAHIFLPVKMRQRQNKAQLLQREVFR